MCRWQVIMFRYKLQFGYSYQAKTEPTGENGKVTSTKRLLLQSKNGTLIFALFFQTSNTLNYTYRFGCRHKWLTLIAMCTLEIILNSNSFADTDSKTELEIFKSITYSEVAKRVLKQKTLYCYQLVIINIYRQNISLKYMTRDTL